MTAKKSFMDITNPFADLPDGHGFLYEARDKLWKLFRDGLVTDCPCCGRAVKCYARSIGATMVKTLRYLANRQNGVALAPEITSAIKKGGGPHAMLALWGLTEDIGSGAWKITEKGQNFLAGNITVPKYLYIYDDTVLGVSKEQVNVHGCKEKFDEDKNIDPDTGAGKEIL